MLEKLARKQQVTKCKAELEEHKKFDSINQQKRKI